MLNFITTPDSEPTALSDFDDGVTVTELISSVDWASTSLGPANSWPLWLKSVVDLCLHSVLPIQLYIGPERTVIHNQKWRDTFQSTYPSRLGRSAFETLTEADNSIEELFQAAFAGKAQFKNDYPLHVMRFGYMEEVYFTLSFSPIFTDTGSIGGVICILEETTRKVLLTRRLKTINDLTYGIQGARSIEHACRLITTVLQDNADIPFVIIYLIEKPITDSEYKPKSLRLEATTFDRDLVPVKGMDGTEEYMYFPGQSSRDLPNYLLNTPDLIDLTEDIDNTPAHTVSEHWPIKHAIATNQNVVTKLRDNSTALLCPITSIVDGKSLSTAVMICGVNKRRMLDKEYEEFFQLAIDRVSSCLTQSRVREAERKQAHNLADLDRQKILFFQNISHELRSPLSLMLLPLGEAIELCPKDSQTLGYLKVVQNNNRRLLNLVNTLLQFAHTEAGRHHAWFCESDIARLTMELAANYESMTKFLGLDYKLGIPSDGELVCQMKQKIFLDRDMYEKIFFNLCSNAFNHTRTGGVTVRLFAEKRRERDGVVLEVSDTGVGIHKEHLSKIFQRFYRVESRHSHSSEGIGIGLALVKELVARHDGEISVESQVNVGTTFCVWIPAGFDHLPRKQVRFESDQQDSSFAQDLYAELSGSSQGGSCENDPISVDDNNLKRVRSSSNVDTDCIGFDNTRKYVLLVDDNADMRNYLITLIKKQFNCICAANGHDALEIIKRSPRSPDLVLSDVMMPGMNGYELLTALRSDPTTQTIPVILISALAGEASVEGLEKGADDYIVKPFDAHELMARIHVNIKLSDVRRQLIAEQRRQFETNKLLFTISNKIRSGFGIQETLDTAVLEVKKILSCDCLLIIQNNVTKEGTSCKVMAASMHPPEELVGRVINRFDGNETVGDYKIQPMTESAIDPLSTTSGNASLASDLLSDELSDSSGLNVKVCTDFESQILHRRVSYISLAIYLKSSLWGWILAYRKPHCKWTAEEKTFFQQVSNQIGLAISHTILIEEKLKREAQMEAAKEANKAKNQILANTSHELRTSVGAIVGALSAFEGTELTFEQRDMVEVMSRASDVVLSVVNDILDAARLEQQKLALISRSFDLLDLIEKSVIMFGERAGAKDIEFIVSYDPETFPRYVNTDPERLQQVMMNFLSNAIKFTDCGEIVMKLSIKKDDGATAEASNNSYLYVEVSDTGVGIDPASIPHIWESFSQGDASMTRGRDGSGLGLSICRSLIDLNGGKYGVDSEFGKGSTFWFTWNIDNLTTASIPTTLFPQGGSGFKDFLLAKSMRVFIIDPLEIARTSYAALIRGSVNKVHTYADCKSAIESARELKRCNEPACELVFFSLKNDNAATVEDAAKELRNICGEHLSIVLMVFSSIDGCALAKSVIERIGENVVAICKPILQKRVIDCISNFDKFMTKLEETSDTEIENNSLWIYSKFYNHNRPTKDTEGLAIIRGVRQSVSDSKSEGVSAGLVPRKRSASDNEERGTSKIAKASNCILCVDDNHITQKIVKSLLDKLGYRYLGAVDGEEAIEMVRAQYMTSASPRSEVKISLILMDCAMPGMSGFETTRAIRSLGSEFQDLPIIALTASALEETREQCLEAGMNDYLSKPLLPQNLNEKLIKWLGEN